MALVGAGSWKETSMISKSERRAALVASSLLALAAAGAAAAAQPEAPAGGHALRAHLTGAAEKPTAGDPKGTGHAMLHIDPAKQQLCYKLKVHGIGEPTMAHIHKGPPTAAGPPVVELKAPGADGMSSGCTAVEPALLKDLMNNPQAYYVNVHNSAFQGGAVRGQLGK
jgi:hypothetical protein